MATKNPIVESLRLQLIGGFFCLVDKDHQRIERIMCYGVARRFLRIPKEAEEFFLIISKSKFQGSIEFVLRHDQDLDGNVVGVEWFDRFLEHRWRSIPKGAMTEVRRRGIKGRIWLAAL